MTRRKKTFSFFLWHRRLGLTALILVFILSITGILLNHTEDFKLDEISIESNFILDWYGINPQGSPIHFTANNTSISQWNQQLFFNATPIYTHKENFQGAVALEDMIAVALENFVLLLDETGEVIELIPTEIPFPISKITTINNKIALLDSQNNTYLSDKNITQWLPKKLTLSNWASASALKKNEVEQLQQAFRGQGLTLERVILDLHSGRLFHPKWGLYIMDASAILMIFLGISGVWVWWSRKLKMHKKKHYRKYH